MHLNILFLLVSDLFFSGLFIFSFFANFVNFYVKCYKVMCIRDKVETFSKMTYVNTYLIIILKFFNLKIFIYLFLLIFLFFIITATWIWKCQFDHHLDGFCHSLVIFIVFYFIFLLSCTFINDLLYLEISLFRKKKIVCKDELFKNVIRTWGILF